MISYIKALLNRLPYISTLYRENTLLKRNSKYPPGHFYSPVISVNELKDRENEIWGGSGVEGIAGLSIDVKSQKNLLNEFGEYYVEIPFKKEKVQGLRYYFGNTLYTYTDGIVLYSMIRKFMPNRIIEIGSGFSSSVMLDTNELFFQNSIDLTFIEPYPQRLLSLMTTRDKQNYNIVDDKVQNVDLSTFEKLNENDILFVDSSHVIKTGSDVNHIIFNILPRLNSGVLIHFHDVFFPFEYPKDWVLKGYNWNETYALKAFLMYNDCYEIILFSDFMHKFYKNAFSELPLAYLNTGGNLWLKKK